jgi:hypothetical protein
MMSSRWIVRIGLLTAVVAGCATNPASVLVVEDPERVKGCRPVGTVSDNEMKDLQRKAAEVGGNVALMTPGRKAKGGYFGMQEYMTADVYRCEYK